MSQGNDETDYTEDYDFQEDLGEDSSQRIFCDICKIYCAGPLPYKDHLDGKKHKKKEVALENGFGSAVDEMKRSTFRCYVCNITCTGESTYQQHLEGVKHQKALKSNQFGQAQPMPTSKGWQASTSKSRDGNVADATKSLVELSNLDKEVSLVGEEFIEEVMDDRASVKQYYCTLCDCRCNDKSVRDAHVRGRPHKVQYKKQVCHDLDIDTKSVRTGKEEEKLRKELMRRRQQELWNMRAKYQGQLMPEKPEFVLFDAKEPSAMFGRHASINKGCLTENSTDEILKRKYLVALCPTAEEMETITNVVCDVESSLKRISDCFFEENVSLGSFKSDSVASGRVLQGVVRVASFGEAIMLKGERTVQLVVLCEKNPTEYLTRKVCEMMQELLPKEKFEVKWDPWLCIMTVSSVDSFKVRVLISFVSSTVRQDGGVSGFSVSHDVLALDKCLDALAKIRRAKWFQARCFDLTNCIMMVRLMRDIRNRLQWPICTWALELLIEKVLITAGVDLSPFEALRRIFEAVASGLFLPDSPGLADPCESGEPVIDALCNLTPQERENITASAQKWLRLIAFGQWEKLLC